MGSVGYLKMSWEVLTRKVKKLLEADTPGPKANRHPLAFGIEASSNRGAAQQLLAASSRAVCLAHG
jgi:hypothetical protein